MSSENIAITNRIYEAFENRDFLVQITFSKSGPARRYVVAHLYQSIIDGPPQPVLLCFRE